MFRRRIEESILQSKTYLRPNISVKQGHYISPTYFTSLRLLAYPDHLSQGSATLISRQMIHIRAQSLSKNLTWILSSTFLYTATMLQNLIDIVTELKGNSKGEKKKKRKRKC